MPTINNRIIKFRIWSPSSKTMFAANFAYPDVDKTCDWVIMEHIGILDKDGKLIYEGDVVEFHFESKDGNDAEYGFGCVDYNFNMASFVINTEHDGIVTFESPSIQHNHVKVIGNIFQNSELLK